MLVFIDDSGDPGFKFNKGSSKYFVIALVIFSDELEAEKAAVAIKELRREMGFPDNVEFKFHKSSDKTKESFLRKVKSFKFTIRSLVVDKTMIRSDELKNNKNSFYSYAIKMVLKHNDGEILNAKIKIDGSGDRIFKRNFMTYLRKELNSGERKIMKNCRLVDSKTNVLIQMADMIAGSVRRSYESDLSDKAKYKSIILSNITDEWKFK
jgi:hypothetical protein